MKTKLLDGKRVLIVDDEPDVLQSLSELLFMCEVTVASTYAGGKELLEKEQFDIAVLDIMGVDGYKLLEIAKEKGLLAVMLTAHAISPSNIVKSFKGGATSYFPKDEISNIPEYLEEIFQAKGKKRQFRSRWLARWRKYYDKKFGPDWQKEDEDFWRKFFWF
ncbi:MAG: response regulator [Desulfobacteraceae bacterium]|nr:MAG: response regulator [Desulfobacteraceae bacterium]